MKDSRGDEERSVVKFSKLERTRHLSEARNYTEKITDMTQTRIADFLSEHYLTMTQARIITQLFFKGEEVSLKELQHRTKFSQPAISKYTRDLENKGVLIRVTHDNISYIAKLQDANKIARSLIDTYIIKIFSKIVRILQDEIDRINKHIELDGPFAEEADNLLHTTIDELSAKQKEVVALVLWAEKLQTIVIDTPDTVQAVDVERLLQ